MPIFGYCLRTEAGAIRAMTREGEGMRRNLLLVLATVLLAQGTTPARSDGLGQTAGEMFETCRQFRDVDFTRKQLNLPADFETGVCWGTFVALYSASNLVNASERRPLLYICPTQDTSVARFISVYLAYLEAHPEIYGEPFMLSAHTSLSKAFPCEGRTFTEDGWK